jgi:hypothetical protein
MLATINYSKCARQVLAKDMSKIPYTNLGRISRLLVGTLLGIGGLFVHVYAQDLPQELVSVRQALEKYQDPIVAVRDGYFSTLGCVEYPTGGMGIHFLNPAHIGPVPDPLHPQILVYEPVGDRLVLVAAEWFIPLATGVKEHPVLFGQRFDGPMEGHEPLLPAALHHYDLHVWLFKPNPAGVFHAVNPHVQCPKTGYTFMEHPPKSVPHQ